MPDPKIQIDHISYQYDDGKQVLRDITLDVPPNAVTVFFGPAGGGKTTLLRLINRLNDLVDGTRREGRILLDGEDIYAPGVSVPALAAAGGDGVCPAPGRCPAPSARTSFTARSWPA